MTGIEYIDIYISNITCRRDIHIIYILAEPLDHPFNPRLLFLNNPRLALHSCEPISTHIILRLYGHFYTFKIPFSDIWFNLMSSGELAIASNLNSFCMFTNPLDDLESWDIAFCRPHLPKVLSDPQFFLNIFK